MGFQIPYTIILDIFKVTPTFVGLSAELASLGFVDVCIALSSEKFKMRDAWLLPVTYFEWCIMEICYTVVTYRAVSMASGHYFSPHAYG